MLLISSSKSHTAGRRQIVTCSKNGILKPKIYMASKEPLCVQEARQNNNWKQAIGDQYTALLRNTTTWDLVSLPARGQAISCKWVFKLKENSDGTINKHKARLVAEGFHQVEGFDFTKTFSLVVKPTTVRIVLSVALHRRWMISQLDVNNAFLN